MSVREHSLGRLEPSDRIHEAKYPLTAETVPAPPTPVVIGIPWYAAFDAPTLGADGRYRIGLGSDWGRVRGGHAVCLKPARVADTRDWWRFYDQGREGACVGFACSRMMTLLNRVRLDAPWLYREAQRTDEWPGEAYSGTSVRAALDVLRARGHRRPGTTDPDPAMGIVEFRWATSSDQILACLLGPEATGQSGHERLEAFPMANSWGDDYPRTVWVPFAAMQRLLDEQGDAAVVSDRVAT